MYLVPVLGGSKLKLWETWRIASVLGSQKNFEVHQRGELIRSCSELHTVNTIPSVVPGLTLLFDNEPEEEKWDDLDAEIA